MKNNKDQIQSEWLKKADLLTETLPFMKRYANKVIVVKFGGNAMGKKEYITSFANDIVLLQQVGMLPVVVHPLGLATGDVVGFTPDSEYEFNIDDTKLYRILSNHITLQYESH